MSLLLGAIAAVGRVPSPELSTGGIGSYSSQGFGTHPPPPRKTRPEPPSPGERKLTCLGFCPCLITSVLASQRPSSHHLRPTRRQPGSVGGRVTSPGQRALRFLPPLLPSERQVSAAYSSQGFSGSPALLSISLDSSACSGDSAELLRGSILTPLAIRGSGPLRILIH